MEMVRERDEEGERERKNKEEEEEEEEERRKKPSVPMMIMYSPEFTVEGQPPHPSSDSQLNHCPRSGFDSHLV
jgi:hypothetical protein